MSRHMLSSIKIRRSLVGHILREEADIATSTVTAVIPDAVA